MSLSETQTLPAIFAQQWKNAWRIKNERLSFTNIDCIAPAMAHEGAS
jgi:hypothetical protein